MAKFKVGDRVKTIVKPSCSALKKGQELTITRVTNYISSVMGRLYGFDDTGKGVYEVEIELAEPPLFRKGDKILVEYEVLADEPQRRPGAGRYVKVTAPGVKAQDGVTRLADFLAAGTITRAPETPYVPEVGDKFSFLPSSGEPSYHVNTLIFSDDKGILYEDSCSRRWISGTGNKFFKR